MKYFEGFIKRCPKTGKIRGFHLPEHGMKIFFPLVGILALGWILFRVLTKPSRLTYPCVKIAMPIATTFIGSLIIYLLAVVTWFKTQKKKIATMALFALVGLGGSVLIDSDSFTLNSSVQLPTIVHQANQPIGKGIGIFPGRVVWVHNPRATNENCVATDTASPWFAPENNNQSVIDSMVSSAIRVLTGASTDSLAWVEIFKFHNARRGKGAVPYSPNEKIFIKINIVSSWEGNYNTNDLSKKKVNWGSVNPYFAVGETSPAIVLSVLRQLVNVMKIPQQNIYVGDPLRHIFKHCYDLWHGEFPNVHYLDYTYNTLGREKVVVSQTAKIFYSDRGSVLRENEFYQYGTTPVYSDSLYTIFEDAEYIINLPILKGHRRAGTTMFAKNHFGSHTRNSANHLHSGLVAPLEMERGIDRPGYGLYRVQVDFMAHSLLGKKQLFFLMDALWATVHELASPLKWQMPPFNNHYMSSVFASFDQVAIESVGYDFLRAEYTAARGAGTYVQMDGVDDYLHQAADSSYWPDNLVYDPDSTGVLFSSLGVHEHWNDAYNKQYARNLGANEGIELVKVDNIVFVERNGQVIPQNFTVYQNYPNPFNPTTIIRYQTPENIQGSLIVYDNRGREITTLVSGRIQAGIHTVQFDASNLTSGVYYVRFTGTNGVSQQYSATMKMMLVK